MFGNKKQSWENCKYAIGAIGEGTDRFVNKPNEMGMYETYACKNPKMLNLQAYSTALFKIPNESNRQEVTVIFDITDVDPLVLEADKNRFGEEDAWKRIVDMKTAPCKHCMFFKENK